MNVVLFHFLIEISKIREGFVVQGEILVAIHVVDIQINTVQRDLKFPVLSYDFPDFIFRHIAPAALTVAEGPFGNHKASADELAELVDDILDVAPGDDIDIQIPVRSGDLQFAVTGISDVKGEDSRVIDKNTKGFFSAHHKEIVGAVKGAAVFQMLRLIRTFTLVDPAAFVDPADIFTQTVDLVVISHGISEGKRSFIHRQEREYPVICGRFLKNGLRLDDMAIGKS